VKRIDQRMTKPDGTLFQEFIHAESSRGILLLISSVVAFVWANSPWATLYTEVWEIPLSITLGNVGLTKPLAFWINDGLMAMFFFVVGLEIKREALTGELNSPRRAALPLAGAFGGMIMPAALYLMMNIGSPGVRGWGIPMATDIAFSLGILSLLGTAIPLGLKTFLTCPVLYRRHFLAQSRDGLRISRSPNGSQPHRNSSSFGVCHPGHRRRVGGIFALGHSSHRGRRLGGVDDSGPPPDESKRFSV
jgi:hypothetical protein